MTFVTFDVLGTPAPQGSKSFKGLTKTGRAILAQPLLPADAPRLPRPHDNCPHNCDHGWLYPNGADGGVTPCPGEAA